MKTKRIIIFLLFLLVLTFSSCNDIQTGTPKQTDPYVTDTGIDTEHGTVDSSPDIETDIPAVVTPADTTEINDGNTETEGNKETSSNEQSTLDFNTENGILIYLDGDKAYSESKSVTVNGTTVVISGGGDFVIKGSLNNGKIVVNAGKKDTVNLLFSGVNITCATSAPVYLLKADQVNILLDKGTENSLSNGGEFVPLDDNNIDGVIFAKTDLTIYGNNASLSITSPAGNGIVAKDTLAISNIQLSIESAGHGIDVNDSLTVDGGTLTINAGKDGIHVENSDDATLGTIRINGGKFEITSAGDGVSAGATLDILGGTFNVVSGGGYVNGEKKTSDNLGMGGFGGGQGYPGGQGRPGGRSGQTTSKTSEDSASIKGIKSSGNMSISGGTFKIDSADDAIHSNGSVIISGGTFDISTGDDGVHADETLTISSGVINVTESYEGLEALHVIISGGEIKLKTTDDGINAAGGTDESGYGGDRGGDRFGGGMYGGGNSNGSVIMSGGNLYINASGDGIDANGTIEISGGHTVVCGPSSGDTTVLDYDKTGVITGGTFIGSGGSMMAQSFSSSTQGVIAVSVGSQQAGAKIILEDSSGNVIIERVPELSYAIVILSSPEIKSGESYTIYVGELSGTITAQ